jgi:arylformamidase
MSEHPHHAAPGPRLWDLSPPVDRRTPAFPGDTPYRQHWVASLGQDCPVNVASLTLSPHLGAHADAPLHYDPQGQAVGGLELLPYLGRCRVIHVIDPGALVTWDRLAHALDGLPQRVLLRCYERMPQDRFDPDLPGIAPEVLERLADLGVQLVGTDSASVDPAASKTLDAHQVLRRRGLRVLENLLLDGVPEGDYELIALPLKLTEADASPVRAVLRELPSHP